MRFNSKPTRTGHVRQTPKTAQRAAPKPIDAEGDIETYLHAFRNEVAVIAALIGPLIKERVGSLNAIFTVAAKSAAARAGKARDSLKHGIEKAEKALDRRMQDFSL
jgi:hypothetical protein